MTDHVHWYPIYGPMFYVRWLSFYRGYIIVRFHRQTWTSGRIDRLGPLRPEINNNAS